MWKLAALAWMPINAVLFGVLVVVITHLPGVTTDFGTGATAIYGAAAASIVLAVPLAWWTARRMLTRRERRLLDATHGEAAAEHR